jgi:3',5'-cyclic AMP phosphodiesterase CpdA
VAQLTRNILAELGDASRVTILISGDVIDDPDDKYVDGARGFLDLVSNLGTFPPEVLLGNHDVRRDGYLNENLRMILRMPGAAARVAWYDDVKIGLVCINSVINGRLARGYVGDQQLIDLGNEIDRKPNSAEYVLLGAIHHHPTPVEHPEWYARPFYERILGRAFERTEVLEDAERVVSFAEQRGFSALLHGHKHIPRVGKTNGGIPVYGCGSSVGKVATRDDTAYMSINLVTVDMSTRQVVGRLLAERIPGAGLIEERRHEMVVRSRAPLQRGAP